MQPIFTSLALDLLFFFIPKLFLHMKDVIVLLGYTLNFIIILHQYPACEKDRKSVSRIVSEAKI